jgi:hypothetical protein
MRSAKITRLTVLIASTITAAAVTTPTLLPAAVGATVTSGAPRATTGAALHVLVTSAQLTAAVNPKGTSTSYYFQWGPTAAYGSQTPTVSVGNGVTNVKVGQAIVGLHPGAAYHFRVVATNIRGETSIGRDRSFLAVTVTPLQFKVTRRIQALAGTPFIFSGSLTGLASASHRVALQASPYPYLEPFTNIGVPGITNALGDFSFRVSNLSSNTQFRVITLDPRPVYSPVVTVYAGVRVTLRARTSHQSGLVRVYGTVTPAAVGAQVFLQLHKAVRPGKNEVTARFVTQFSTVTKKATRTYSRFSVVVSVRQGGRYRAYVKPPKGPLASGYSSTLVLHASPAKAKRKA